MAFNYSEIFMKDWPPKIYKHEIKHKVPELKWMGGNKLIGRLLETKNYQYNISLQRVNTEFFPHLFESVAIEIYPFWKYIFSKTWNRRSKSRFNKDLDFPFDSYSDGIDVASFRRFIAYVITGKESILYWDFLDGGKPITDGVWPNRFELSWLFGSYIMPFEGNFHEHTVEHRSLYSSGSYEKISLFDRSYDWKLNDQERQYANNLRQKILSGNWPELPSNSSDFKYNKPLACIYYGEDEFGKGYVGQTLNEPEMRWVQHRKERTGPFKDGSSHVNWSVLKKDIEPSELDYWEAYYVAVYDSYENGHNATKGNSEKGYYDGLNRK